jgi:hypothetical protein
MRASLTLTRDHLVLHAKQTFSSIDEWICVTQSRLNSQASFWDLQSNSKSREEFESNVVQYSGIMRVKITQSRPLARVHIP